MYLGGPVIGLQPQHSCPVSSLGSRLSSEKRSNDCSHRNRPRRKCLISHSTRTGLHSPGCALVGHLKPSGQPPPFPCPSPEGHSSTVWTCVLWWLPKPSQALIFIHRSKRHRLKESSRPQLGRLQQAAVDTLLESISRWLFQEATDMTVV
jgi:hypothetical protein